jgi:uncharacterized protein YhaN
MSDYSPDSRASEGVTFDAFLPIILLFIPIAILSISMIVLLNWQIKNSSTQSTQLDSLITRQVPAVTQSQKVQDSVSKLVNDLLAASQNDATAKAIVDKYQIKSSAAAGADAAAAAASPGL